MIRPIYVSRKCPAVVSPILALRVKRSSKIRHQWLVPRIWLKTGRMLLFLSKNFTQVRFRPSYSASRSQFPLKSFSSYSWKDGDINHWRACRKANYQWDLRIRGRYTHIGRKVGLMTIPYDTPATAFEEFRLRSLHLRICDIRYPMQLGGRHPIHLQNRWKWPGGGQTLSKMMEPILKELKYVAYYAPCSYMKSKYKFLERPGPVLEVSWGLQSLTLKSQ